MGDAVTDRLLESGDLRLIQPGDTRLLEVGGGSGTIGPIADVAIHVALGYYGAEADLFLWDVAEWDVGEWADVAPLDDISCHVVSVAIGLGRDQPLDRFRTGTATVELDDPDGRYSPWSTAATPDEYTGVRVGIDLVIWAEIAGFVYPRFRGIVDQIIDDWPEQSRDPGTPHRVTFHAMDYLADLAAFDGFEQPPTGAGELSGARIGRVLDNAHYTRPRDVDEGTVPVQATTLAGRALDEAGLTTDTERGALFVNRSGTLVFRDRNGLGTDPAYTSVQALFGDRPLDGEVAIPELEDEICYSAISPVSDASKIRNQVAIARAGGSTVLDSDLTSQALYGVRTYRRLDLIHTTDAESAVIAAEYLTAYAYAANRIEGLTVDLVAVSHYASTILSLEPLHLIEVRRRAEGFQIVAALQIQAMAERITAESWAVELRTFPVDPENVFDVALWNASAWDVGLWGY